MPRRRRPPAPKPDYGARLYELFQLSLQILLEHSPTDWAAIERVEVKLRALEALGYGRDAEPEVEDER